MFVVRIPNYDKDTHQSLSTAYPVDKLFKKKVEEYLSIMTKAETQDFAAYLGLDTDTYIWCQKSIRTKSGLSLRTIQRKAAIWRAEKRAEPAPEPQAIQVQPVKPVSVGFQADFGLITELIQAMRHQNQLMLEILTEIRCTNSKLSSFSAVETTTETVEIRQEIRQKTATTSQKTAKIPVASREMEYSGFKDLNISLDDCNTDSNTTEEEAKGGFCMNARARPLAEKKPPTEKPPKAKEEVTKLNPTLALVRKSIIDAWFRYRQTATGIAPVWRSNSIYARKEGAAATAIARRLVQYFTSTDPNAFIQRGLPNLNIRIGGKVFDLGIKGIEDNNIAYASYIYFSTLCLGFQTFDIRYKGLEPSTLAHFDTRFDDMNKWCAVFIQKRSRRLDKKYKNGMVDQYDHHFQSHTIEFIKSQYT